MDIKVQGKLIIEERLYSVKIPKEKPFKKPKNM